MTALLIKIIPAFFEPHVNYDMKIMASKLFSRSRIKPMSSQCPPKDYTNPLSKQMKIALYFSSLNISLMKILFQSCVLLKL